MARVRRKVRAMTTITPTRTGIYDTILVTLYNAPDAERLRPHYENLPRILLQQNIDPRVPWLYNFKLDFRFK